MARPSHQLVSALRETADRVEAGARYEWGHMAHCNCGHLVQTLTRRTGREISRSINHCLDEWSEHARDYCDRTGQEVEDLFIALSNAGFDRDDVAHLETLSDRAVLNRIGDGVHLRRNQREDLVLYLQTMADLLEDQLPKTEAPWATLALVASR